MSTTIALLCLLLLPLLLLLRPAPRLIPVSPHSPRVPPSPDVEAPFPASSPRPTRLSTPPRLSLTGRRRSSTASCTSALSQLDAPSSPPLRRTRFPNPFNRSRTLSPPSTSKSPSAPPLNPSSMPSSPPPQCRRPFVNKFKSVFKSSTTKPSSIIHSKPILTVINTKLRRKPVARTEPYGPPWNAPMPVPEFTLSQHSLEKATRTPPQISRKHSVRRCSRSEIASTSPNQLSPRAFINELDEKLSSFQQQCIQESIPLSRG